MRGIGITQKLEIWNTTKLTEALESPKGRLAQIELLVCCAAFLLIFLEVFGAYRRRCNNAMFRLILWTAYTIPASLITYALGLMQAATYKKDLFVIWSVFLLILLGNADSISAYSLEDNEQWKRYNWQLLIKALGLGLLLSSYASTSLVMVANAFLYFVVTVRVIELSAASMLASKAVLQKNAKLMADYMMKEHRNCNEDEVDLNSMKGFTYLVRGEEEEKQQQQEEEGEQSLTLTQRLFIKFCCGRKKLVEAEAPVYHVPIKSMTKVITVEKVWQCQGNLIKEGDKDYHIKDICLSFALFKILSLRFAGYSMPHKVHQRSWKLFQNIIQDKKGGYERAFRIIEVELAFVFHQFYTKYHFMFQPRHWILKVMKLAFVILGSCVVASIIWCYRKPKDDVQLATWNGVSIDAFATATMIIAFLILEILQLCFMIFSECGKVFLICNYVKKESWQKKKSIEKLIKFICRTELLKPWERKLRQYSLLESYGYSPSLYVYNDITAVLFDQTKEGQVQSNPEELSTEVKLAVVSSLPSEGTKLENGKTSLIRNNVQKCLWACNLETQAQVILVWHIATSICEHDIPRSQPDTLKKFKIATSLSKYLAYLVAFAPRLLPGNPSVTEYVFDQVIIETRKTFKKGTSLKERIGELSDKRSREEHETVIDRGARLGKQLLDVQEPERVWKILADFWVELMLYVAPSDDMDAHAKHLTMGGEFITQIWALLSHSTIERYSHSNRPMLERSRSCPTT